MKPESWGYGNGPFTKLLIGIEVDERIAQPVITFIQEAQSWAASIGAVEGRGATNSDPWVCAGAGFYLGRDRHSKGDPTTKFPVRKVRSLCQDLGFVWGRDLPEVDCALFRVKAPANVMARGSVRPETEHRPRMRRPMSRGDWGPTVEWASARLANLGYLQEEPSHRFTLAMSRAVRRFQNDHGLRVTGVISGQVYDMLNEKVGSP